MQNKLWISLQEEITHSIYYQLIQSPCSTNINIEGIIKLLNQLNPNKPSGPDNISARLLRETLSEIAPAFALIFQALLYQQSIPDDWCKANVTPIYKPGKKDRGKAENYRPISLTSISY